MGEAPQTIGAGTPAPEAGIATAVCGAAVRAPRGAGSGDGDRGAARP